MKSRTPLSQLIRFFGFVFLIDLAVIAIIAGISWWAGWQTQDKFKYAIQIAGIMVIGMGFLRVKGNRVGIRSFENQHSMSTQESRVERTRKILRDFTQKYNFMLAMRDVINGGITNTIVTAVVPPASGINSSNIIKAKAQAPMTNQARFCSLFMVCLLCYSGSKEVRVRLLVRGRRQLHPPRRSKAAH